MSRSCLRHTACSLVLTTLLAACGGGGGGDSGGGTPPPVTEMPAARAKAARFLTQASFGPTDAAIDRAMLIGYAAWIDEQFT